MSKIVTTTLALELIGSIPRSSAITKKVSEELLSRSISCAVVIAPEVSLIVKKSAAALSSSKYLTYTNKKFIIYIHMYTHSYTHNTKTDTYRISSHYYVYTYVLIIIIRVLNKPV